MQVATTETDRLLSDLRAHAELVFEHHRRSRVPATGQIYRHNDHYYAVIISDDSDLESACYGPFPSLHDALPAFNNNAVTAGTERIWCPELAPERLIPTLSLYAAEHPGFTINQQPYRVANSRIAAS